MAHDSSPATQAESALSEGPEPASLRVEVHSSFATIASDWMDLETHALATPFQSFHWLSAWHDKIGRQRGLEPAIILLRDQLGRPVFLLPLVVDRSGPIGRVAWDMGQPVCDYHAPLMSQSFLSTAGADSMAEIWDRVLAALEGTADTVVLIKQPDRIGFTPNPMASLCTAPYFTPTAFQTDLRPYDDFQAFAQAKRSSKARSRLRGKRNKLNRMGEVKFELLRNSDERAAALTELLFQKKRDLLQAGKRHIFDDPGVAEFLQTVIGEYEDVKLFRMSCGTQTVALTLAVVWHKRLHYFIATYHREQFGQCSPGVLALCDTFDWSLANGCEQFDFTVGDEPYKLEWSDQETRLFSGTFAVTPKGRIAERLEAAKLSLKHTIKSSPAMYAAASKLLFHSQR